MRHVLAGRTVALGTAVVCLGALGSTVAVARTDVAAAGMDTTTLDRPGFLLAHGRYTTISVPAAQSTTPVGITDSGTIVGEYADAGGVEHGFLRDTAGRFTTIDVPGALSTNASRINSRGQIVGAYSETTISLSDLNAQPHGFLLERGRFSRIDFPNALQTQALGINDRGEVVGGYVDQAGTPHGFRWRHGRFTTVDPPGSLATLPADINDKGQIVGTFLNAPPVFHGFLLSGGAYTVYDAPDAVVTFLTGINDRGQVVGTHSATDAAANRGLLLPAGIGGRFVPLDVPGATVTEVFDINDRGDIVGDYETTRRAVGQQILGSAPAKSLHPAHNARTLVVATNRAALTTSPLVRALSWRDGGVCDGRFEPTTLDPPAAR
jgi:probable HAF family extracellular repeat protein